MYIQCCVIVINVCSAIVGLSELGFGSARKMDPLLATLTLLNTVGVDIQRGIHVYLVFFD